MQTIEYGVLTAHFAKQAQKARFGHAVMVTRHDQPYCIVAHPSLLTEEESSMCEHIAATNLYSKLAHCCARIESDKAMFMITSHGLARCCMVPPHFVDRARALDTDLDP